MTSPFDLLVEFELAHNTKMGDVLVSNIDTALTLVHIVSNQEDEALVHLELESVEKYKSDNFSKYWSVRIFSNELGYCAFHNTGNFKLLIAGQKNDLSTDFIALKEPVWDLVYFLPKTMFYTFEEITQHCTDVFESKSVSSFLEIDQPR